MTKTDPPLRLDLRLDLNEGARPGPELLAALDDPALLRLYPDRAPLEKLLAGRFGVAPERVVVTAGADDALDRCCRVLLGPGRPALLPDPGFGTLDRLATAAGGEPLRYPWPGGQPFPGAELLAALEESPGMVVLISPGNPTGETVAPDDLRRVLAAAAERAIPVILDQVYAEYAAEATREATGIALASPGVVVARTFSKAWGMAGCRVGYLIAPPDLAARLRAVGNPYPVSGPSLALVTARLGEGEEALRQHVEEVARERGVLAPWLRGRGLAVPESRANFLLVRAGGRARFLARGLASLGVRVRSFERASLADAIRITLPGDAEDFGRLQEALATVLAPEALLLDLDGVLVDVRASYDAAILATVREYGVEATPEDVVAERRLGDANNDWVLTRRLLARRGREVSLEEVTERFQRHYLGAGGRPGLRELERSLVPEGLLGRLAARLPLGIVTGRPRAEAEHVLAQMGWREAISALVTLDDGPPKPSPEPVEKALAALGVRRAWLLGDTPDDLAAARAAGALPLGVVAPDGVDAATLYDRGAARVLSAAAELEEML